MADNNEIVNIGVNASVNIDTTLLKKTIDGLSKSISISFATAAVKSVDGFAKKLKEKLQFAFDDTVIGSLKAPIKITLDTKDANAQIDVLNKKLQQMAKPLANLTALSNNRQKEKAKQTRGTKPELTDAEKKAEILRQRDIFNASSSIIDDQILSAKRTTNNPGLRSAKEQAIAEAEKIRKDIELTPSKNGLFTEAQLVSIQKKTDKIEKIFNDYVAAEKKFQADRKKLLSEASTLSNKNSLDKLLTDIDSAKSKLESKGFTEKQVISATKSISTQIANLFKDADLLADALKKKTPDLKLVEDLVNRINKNTFAAKSKVSSIGTTKDISVAPTVAGNAKTSAANAAADAAELAKITAAFNPGKLNQSKSALDGLHNELISTNKEIARSGVPITFVTKQTSSYDKSIINLNRDLQNLEKEFNDGNITLTEAAKKYEKLTADIRKLAVGINQIDKTRIKDAFTLQDTDPGNLGVKFAGLGFTVGRVAGALGNFSQQSIQAFSQLAQFAEPIERVNNALNLQIKQGLITAEQRDAALARLRAVGDIPGSSVESANKTFEQLKRINLTLKERLDLTEGLSKLPSLTGGDPNDANQLANALTKAASKGKFEGENFQTLLAQGGEPVQKLNEALGIRTADDITDFGVLRYIRALNKELVSLDVPAATTTDRVNRLKSRVAEFGIILGRVVAPALDSLNVFLRDTLQPIVDRLVKSFDSLSPSAKSFISTIVVGLPIVAGAFAGLLAVLTAVGFAASSIIQSLNLIKAFRASDLAAKFGLGAKVAATAAPAAPAALLGGGLAGPAGIAGLAGGPLGPAAVAGLAGSSTAAAASVGTLAKITGFMGTILKGLPKILGLTTPIGIAINLLLSAVIAFFQNFLGVKDRLLNAFSKLDAPINKLLKALGLDEGGLAYVLEKIGQGLLFLLNSVSSLFSLIGGTVVEGLTAVVQTIGDVINNIADLIEAIKSGNFGDAFVATFKLIGNTVLGLFNNIAINIAALLADAIASAFEATLGAGSTSAFLRRTSDEIRKQNGSDIASAAVEERKRAEKKANQEIFDEKKQQEQDLIDLARTAEQERQERIKQAGNELAILLKKSREDFKKLIDEQKQQSVKERGLTLQQQGVNASKFANAGFNLAATAESAGFVAVEINRQLDLIKQKKIANQQELSNLEAMKQIRDLISPQGELKPLFTLFDAGDPRVKDLVLKLQEINNTTDFSKIPQLSKDLTAIAERAERVKFLGMDPKTPPLTGLSTQIRTITEKVGVASASGNVEIEKIKVAALEEQSNIQKQLAESKARIEQDDRERAAAIEDRLKAQKQLQEDINKEIENEVVLRDEVLSEINKENQERKSARLRRKRETDAYLITLEREKVEITNNAKLQKELLENDVSISPENRKLGLDLLKEQSDKKLRNIENEINIVKKGAKELEDTFTKLNTAVDRSAIIRTYRDIFAELRNISNQSLDTLSKFTDTFARFSTKFSSIGGINSGNLPGTLPQELERLLKQEGLSELSSGYIELRNIINEINNGGDLSKGVEKFIQVLAKLKAQPEIDEFNKQLEKTNLIIKTIFGGTGASSFISDSVANANPNKLLPGSPVSKKNIGALLGKLLGPDGLNDARNNIGDAITKQETFDFSFKEILTKALEEGQTKGGKDFEQAILDILITIGNVSEKSLMETLDKVFKFDKAKSLLVLEAIKTYQAKIKMNASITQGEIDGRLTQLDSFSKDKLTTNSNETSKLQDDLRNSERKSSSATGGELRRLREQQRDIKVQLIDFNYERLDLEEAYNIQKKIIQANGNIAEIEEIKRAGLARRTELQAQRDQELKDLYLSQGGRVGKNGELLDANGNPIKLKSSVITPDIGAGDTSGGETDTTRSKGDIPVLSKSQGILAGVNSIKDGLDGIGNSARDAGNAILDLFNRLASGEGVINLFKDLIGGMKFDLKALGKTFTELAKFGVAAFAQALGAAITDSIVNGGNFLKSLGKFFGDILISIGGQLIALGAAALAFAALAYFFPGIVPAQYAIGVPAAIAAIAVGTGLVFAGKAIGGGGNSAAANASNTGAANAAGSSAGTSGQVDYDPEKDPKLVYQKALRTEVYIDIKRDDGSIVKSIIRQVNRNPAFANLIGNARTGFVL